MLFDAMNEALQRYRPYELKGTPMPWSSSVRELSRSVRLELVITEVVDELESWSMLQAGKVPTADMMLSSGLMDEESLQDIREERLANMLATEVLENDHIWVDYEWEEA